MSTPASGYAYLGQDEPSSFQMMQFLQQQNERRRLLQEQKEQKDAARRLQISNYVGEAFDPSKLHNFAQSTAGEFLKKWTEKSKEYEKAGLGAFQNAVRNDQVALQQTDALLKAGADAIRKRADQYKNDGINTEDLYNLALHDFAFKVDKDGKKVLRSPQELQESLNEDHIEKMFMAHPDKLVDADDPNPLGDFKGVKVMEKSGNYFSKDAKGGSREKKYRLGFYEPYQEIDELSGSPVVKRKSQKVKFGDVETEVASDEAYNNFVHDTGRRMKVYAAFKKAHDGRMPNLKDEDDVNALKYIVYNYLPKTGTKVDMDADRVVAPPAPVTHITVSTSEGGKEVENPVTSNTILAGMLEGDKFDSTARKVKLKNADGKEREFVDALSNLGGEFRVVNPATGKAIKPKQILVDPQHRDRGYYIYHDVQLQSKKDKSKKITKERVDVVTPDQLKNWMLQTGRLHAKGGNFEKSDSDVEKNFDAEGKPRTLVQRIIDKAKKITTRRSVSGRL